MWRTLAILLLAGFLLASVGANGVLFQQAAANRAEGDAYRERLKTAQQVDRPTLEARLNELSAENERLKQGQPAAAAGGTPRPGTPIPGLAATPGPGTPDRTILTRIEDQVAQLRGLRRQRDVPLNILGQDALRKYFVDQFQRDYLPSERESDQKLLLTLGLVQPNQNVVQILLDLLQEQVIGIYDEDVKSMYVIGDSATFGPLEQSTFAHEYTHALQDQTYDLATLAPKRPENDDQSLAIHAVLEGDAVLLQALWERDNLTPEQVANMYAGASTAKIDQSPPFIRSELLFPYTDGFAFVRAAYQSAGGSYAGVDALLKNPPDSTEQILHPDKYRTREKPIAVEIPDLAPRMGQGWRRLDGNTMGELDLRSLLEQYADRTAATRGAQGWGGDRWQLLEQGNRQAVVLRTAWDTENDAREFYDAYSVGLRNRFSGARVDEQTTTRQALTFSTNATELRVKGREVLAVISFDRPTAEALVAAVGF